MEKWSNTRYFILTNKRNHDRIQLLTDGRGLAVKFIEADPLPEACQCCVEQYCDECEHMGERWLLSPEDIRRLKRKARERAAVRFQRELEHFKD